LSAVSSFVADILAAKNLASASDKATHFVVVVAGALIKAARLALVASASVPISTLPGVVPIVETNVNVTHAIVTVSLAVGFVANANSADPHNKLDV
jgi:hypothetical protein